MRPLFWTSRITPRQPSFFTSEAGVFGKALMASSFVAKGMGISGGIPRAIIPTLG
jgi:hypothetical protein